MQSVRLRRLSASSFRKTALHVLFGDRRGLLVFLASLCLFGVAWRTSVLITDTYTLANGLYALSNGTPFLTEAAYGQGLETPGVTQVDGRLIARNYGAIVPALPLWILLEGVALVADLRIALLGLWSLTLLAFVVQLGKHLHSKRVTIWGTVAVVLFFLFNVAVAFTLDPTKTHLYALQLFHLVVAAFTPVLFYRLVSRLETPRLGLLGATVLLLGTPLLIWASIPKRHVLTGTMVLTVAYALYRSRIDADGAFVSNPVLFRASAYGAIGLYAWIHAPEALLCLTVLAAVDIPTAPENSVSTLSIIGVVFLLSLLPFFLTNFLTAGSLIRPPRLLAHVSLPSTNPSPGGSAVANSAPQQRPYASTGLFSTVLSLFEPFSRPFRFLVSELTAGLSTIAMDPSRLYHTVIRSAGTDATLNRAGTESVNLSILESAPVLAGATGAVTALWRTDFRSLITDRPPVVAVDLFALFLTLAVTLLYITRLPLHTQVTVRYLFPVYLLGIYGLVRIPVVRQTLDTEWRLFGWTTAISLFIGGQLVAVTVFWTAVSIGEAFQLHGVLALIGALPLATWALVGKSDGLFGRAGAVFIGIATALTTIFVFLLVVEYYPLSDTQLLPLLRVLGESIDIL